MIDTILFDLDGTLLDTNELILASFLAALDGKTKETYTREKLIPHMGLPLSDQMERFADDPADVPALVDAYRHFNLTQHDAMVALFPNVYEVMEQLHQQGIRMGLVTSKGHEGAMKGLDLFRLTPMLEVIVTLDDVAEAKPHPEGIIKAMQVMKANRSSTLMVGDSTYDIEAGHRAGIRSAGVAWAIKGEAVLRQCNPEYMLYDMRDLLNIVEQDS